MSESMENLECELLATLEDDKFNILASPYGDDRISEHVDSAVPVYNGCRAEVLASCSALSDYGTEYSSGDEGIYERIGYAIYEYLSEVAYKWRAGAELLPEDCTLVDDGTMDTVISVCGELQRFDCDTAADYRDDETGELDLDGFIEDVVLPSLT